MENLPSPPTNQDEELLPPASPSALMRGLSQVASPPSPTKRSESKLDPMEILPENITFDGLSPDTVSNFSEVAQFIRECLVQIFTVLQGESNLPHKALVRLLFSKIDPTCNATTKFAATSMCFNAESSAELTTAKFVEFVLKMDIFSKFSERETNEYIQMLIEQIDINRGGTITIKELHDFIWKPTGHLLSQIFES